MNSFKNLESISKTVDSLKVSIDPRMELLSAVQINADYPFLSPYDFQYKNKMIKYFSKHKNHEAVKLHEEFLKKGFAYDAPVELMLNLSEELKLENSIDDSNIMKIMESNENLNCFIDEIRQYYNETNFAKFYSENTELYNIILDEVVENIRDRKIIKKFEDYYGYKQNSYNIILSPVVINGGYGIRINNNKNEYDCYTVFGTMEVRNQLPTFYAKVSYKGYTCDYIFIMLIWHEFGHSFINPLTKKYIDQVNKYKRLYEPIAEKLKVQGYGDWKSFVNEQIIEAIVARLTSIHCNKKDAEISLEINRDIKGLIYIDEIYNRLEKYENNRDKYPTLNDFYPEFIKLFNELSQ